MLVDRGYSTDLVWCRGYAVDWWPDCCDVTGRTVAVVSVAAAVSVVAAVDSVAAAVDFGASTDVDVAEGRWRLEEVEGMFFEG